MSKINYVLVYDSGVGGLTTLSECKKLLPSTNFLFFADHENCPYGTKSPEELTSLILTNIQKIMQTHNICAIVLACNTATTSCIHALRQTFSIPIIGTEPNLKSPTRENFEHITLLATPATLAQKRTKHLEIETSSKIHNISCGNLAHMIEDYVLSKNHDKKRKIQRYIKHKLKFTPKYHAITLGCTHYVFMKKYISNTLGYKCFDGNAGVAKRLADIMSSNNFACNEHRLRFFSSSLSTSMKLKHAFFQFQNTK